MSHRFGVRAEQLLRAWATPFTSAASAAGLAGPPTQEPLRPRRFARGDHALADDLRRASAARRFVAYIMQKKNFAHRSGSYEFFLVDSQMEPVVRPWRVRLGARVDAALHRSLL